MGKFKTRQNRMWLVFILIISTISLATGNIVSHQSVIGGVILGLILFLIPFGVELLRKNDPIEYYGLDFETLKRVNLKQVFLIAFSLFVFISLIDHFVFNLWGLMLSQKQKTFVGSTTLILAKSNVFYLGFIVIFAGTLLEELWFRGLIQYKVKGVKFLKKANPHFAIIFQSILFGLIHFLPIYFGTDFSLSLKLWFFAYPTIIGFVLGYLNEKYQSLWPGWIIHYTNNILALLLLTILVRV